MTLGQVFEWHADVRFGSLADIARHPSHVRYTPKKRTSGRWGAMSALCQKRSNKQYSVPMLVVHANAAVETMQQATRTIPIVFRWGPAPG